MNAVVLIQKSKILLIFTDENFFTIRLEMIPENQTKKLKKLREEKTNYLRLKLTKGNNMSKTNKKTFSSSFKAKVALVALKSEKTIPQISQEFGVHPTQISNWKKQLLDNMDSIFVESKKTQKNDENKQIEKLHAKIGKLLVEKDFLEQALKS